MKSKINLIALIISIAISTVIVLQAKADKNYHRNHKCKVEKTHLEQEMADKLNALKANFDSKLNDSDLAVLNSLRKIVKESRLDMESKMMELKSLDLERKELKTKVSELKEKSKGKREEVKTTLKELLDNNQDAVKSLVRDLKDLRANYNHKNRVSKNHQKKEKDKHRLARFILHDEFVATENRIKDIVYNSKRLDISINQNLLTFESKKESNNSIYKLYNMNGVEISNISNQSLLIGSNTVNLNIFNTNIEKGRYFLVIENESGLSAGKFIYIK